MTRSMIRDRLRSNVLALSALVAALTVLLGPPGKTPAHAAPPDSLEAIVELRAMIPADARTADSLGTEREGTGVVIDDAGLIVTIGYVVLEALEVEIVGSGPEPLPASIVAYDHRSGFGLLRAARELDVEPIPLGSSADVATMQPLLAVSHVGEIEAKGVYVVDRRDFAGYWEYLLEDAIFTSPPHRQFGGAALLDQSGRLVGIGSLVVGDAAIRGRPVPGNMFVPIDALKPILGDLLDSGRRSEPPRPWLGAHFEEQRGRVVVTRTAPDGPAAAAGIEADDLVLGVGGAPVEGLADLYRKVWARGDAGVEVPLQVLRELEVTTTVVRSGDRHRYLRLDPSY